VFYGTRKKSYQGKTIIIATGVSENYPQFDTWRDCLGKSMFWCITCDGYKTENKKVLVVGENNEAVLTALQLQQFTSKISFLTNCDEKSCEISNEYLKRLSIARIPIYYGLIANVRGKNGMLESVSTATQEIKTEILFNQQEATPRNELAKQLGLRLKQGYISVDEEQRTNIPFVYAAGDVTKQFAHQVVTAAHEGSMAAQSANYDLYSPEQKE
jgi:thioredoxin reductase (NADPH)